jgi:predicted O-methyltransferase YrrM
MPYRMTSPGSRSTLREPSVAAALDEMFARARRDDEAYERALARHPEGFASSTHQERADACAELYMPISAQAGRLLYALVRAARPMTVVEFGTSFGISALHLAAAVRDNGIGHVVTTEMSAAKAASASRTFAETGLDDVVTVLEGDALETLPGHLAESGARTVDFVLLDGWKDLYIPVLRMLEPRLTPGALVVADDTRMESVKPYLEYVRDPGNGYETVEFPVEDGMEISSRL